MGTVLLAAWAAIFVVPFALAALAFAWDFYATRIRKDPLHDQRGLDAWCERLDKEADDIMSEYR